MKDYRRKQYYDERWKTLRWEVLKRDNFTCSQCGKKKPQEYLHAHHIFYYEGERNVWDYDPIFLVTLCSTCHNDWHIKKENHYLKPIGIRNMAAIR